MGTYRMLLAISVALGHSGMIFGYIMMNGVMAVQVFFVISGFLIAFILNEKYDTSTLSGLWLFYSNRGLRIYLPYWFFWLLTVVVGLSFYAAMGSPIFSTLGLYIASGREMHPLTWLYVGFTNIFIFGQELADWLQYTSGDLHFVRTADGLTTIPVGGFHVIPQAWSMSLELMFYLLAPLLARRGIVTLAAIAALAFFVRQSVYDSGDFNTSGWGYRFFPFELGQFVLGMASYRFYRLLRDRGWLTDQVVVIAFAGVIGLMFFHQYLYVMNLYPYRYYVAIAVALPFLFRFSQRFKWDRWLGELSYPIYLSHLSVVTFVYFVKNLLHVDLAQGWMTVVSIGVTIALCVLYLLFVDAPLERWRQARVERRGSARAPAAAVAVAA